MSSYVLGLPEVDATMAAAVGGKGAGLGELRRVDGVRVPPGSCVTTDAFRRVLATDPGIERWIGQLAAAEDPRSRNALAAELRAGIEAIDVPGDVADAIAAAVERLGPGTPLALRSSATAEDLPTASFAGQQDSFLGIVGAEDALRHVARCWASLFTDRAVAYRAANGFDHGAVHMAVVVQELVPADASGVAFTADPVTGNRRVVAIEAVAGLGDALVSGLVDPDRYEVRDGELAAGGADGRVLTTDQALELAALARRIEAHFGSPQDIEWCLADGTFHVVQSRPITTLFPVPEVDDHEPHVFVSVGHQQMMTDPMKPLGLSVWQLTAARPMHVAAGRLFVDVGANLASPTAREAVITALGRSDPLIGDALRRIVERGDVVPERPDPDPADAPPGPPAMGLPPVEPDDALVAELIAEREASLADLAGRLDAVDGPELFDVIAEDLRAYQQLFDARSIRVIMSAIESSWWLDEQLEGSLGERGAADVLTRSAPGNVTSEMGLALLDVADVIRPHPEVVAFLRSVDDDDFLDRLAELGPAGIEVRDALQRFLDRYGMRCVGEIDITRPRWSERPSMLLPVLLGNVDNLAPGGGVRRFEQGRAEAEAKAADVVARLRSGPDGDAKAAEAERHIAVVRTFIGFREFPKYALVRRYFLYKRALRREVSRLVAEGVLREVDDAWFLTLPELGDAARTHHVDLGLVDERRRAFETYAALTPPRVMTGDGEVVTGRYARVDLPDGALVGLAVSAGTVEGRARVVHDVAGADLRPGDVLVTTHTDPSWSPVFASIAGLVTEVGGVMTHGAVVAREYGLPAVVGVVDATKLIRDGQRIRVDGTDGHVELLPD